MRHPDINHATTRATYDAILLDLDGVITDTANMHATCWEIGAAMDTSALTTTSKHHRFPAEIISHSVRLSYRFYLSYRDVEEVLFKRGVIVTYEAIRQQLPFTPHLMPLMA